MPLPGQPNPYPDGFDEYESKNMRTPATFARWPSESEIAFAKQQEQEAQEKIAECVARAKAAGLEIPKSGDFLEKVKTDLRSTISEELAKFRAR